MIEVSSEIYEGLLEVCEALPIDKFVTKYSDGAFFVDWEQIDAADFKDNSGAFCKAMRKAAVILAKINKGKK